MAELGAAIAAGKLATNIQEAVRGLDGAKQLKRRYRSLELVIANNLKKHNLVFRDVYFDSGTWFSQPDTVVSPENATVATVANKQGSVLCGVTGGMAWEIEGTGKFLIIGFNNPTMGSFKNWIGACSTSDPKYGYDNSKDESIKRYRQAGFTLLCQMKESEIADRRFIFVIGKDS